jgi:hypothetical protein
MLEVLYHFLSSFFIVSHNGLLNDYGKENRDREEEKRRKRRK